MPWAAFLSIFPCILIPLTSSDFTSDLERVVFVHSCNPYCTFNESEITSRTVDMFPKSCEAVCGILTFNQNTDLTETEVKELLKKMIIFFGGLRFENTSFSNLNFFAKNPTINAFDFDCSNFGLTVINNSELTDISFLNDVFLATDRLTEECIIKFENNPKLDASALCDDPDLEELFELKVSGNLKNCGCRGDLITSENVEGLKNCERIEGGLHLFNVSSEVSNYLMQISHIKGDVEIRKTGFKDLSFFKNLKEIQTKHGLITEKVSVNIHDNPEMTRLGISGLKRLDDILEGPFILNLENLHPDFCLTYQEFLFFLENFISFENIQAKVCAESKKTKVNGMKVCEFKNLKSLGYDCWIVHGNIVINSENEEYIDNLQGLDTLFGTLTIQNTKLERLEFLGYLRNIVSLEEDYVIEILSNKKLISAELPSLKNIITNGPRTVVLDKNPKLESENCMIFPLTYETNVAFIGDNCGSPTSSSAHHSNFCFLALVFIGALGV